MNVVVSISLFLTLGGASLGDTQSTHLIRFEIEDQFGRAHHDAELRGHVLLVASADKTGSQYQGRWVDAIRASTHGPDGAPSVRIVEVADLRGVPFVARGWVRKKFPSDLEQWVLMDWKGLFAKTYGLEREKCNILVFDRTGRLRHRAAVQDLEQGTLELMRETLATLVRAD